jgi:hypothetical protein
LKIDQPPRRLRQPELGHLRTEGDRALANAGRAQPATKLPLVIDDPRDASLAGNHKLPARLIDDGALSTAQIGVQTLTSQNPQVCSGLGFVANQMHAHARATHDRRVPTRQDIHNGRSYGVRAGGQLTSSRQGDRASGWPSLFMDVAGRTNAPGCYSSPRACQQSPGHPHLGKTARTAA